MVEKKIYKTNWINCSLEKFAKQGPQEFEGESQDKDSGSRDTEQSKLRFKSFHNM